MLQRTLSPQKLQEIQDLAAQWGKIVVRRLDPTTGLDFQAMEQVAAAAATGLTEGTLDTLLEQQAQTLGTQQRCPDCGRLCPVDYEDRPLAVHGGHLTLARSDRKAPEGEEVDAHDPRRLVADALCYLGNNQSRMDYPRDRRAGLPITSSLVESLVGEFNARVKSREKFWNRPKGAEAILPLRAAVLSEDDRLARFFAQRPGNPHRRHKAA